MKRVDPLHFIKKIFGGLIILSYIYINKQNDNGKAIQNIKRPNNQNEPKGIKR